MNESMINEHIDSDSFDGVTQLLWISAGADDLKSVKDLEKFFEDLPPVSNLYSQWHIAITRTGPKCNHLQFHNTFDTKAGATLMEIRAAAYALYCEDIEISIIAYSKLISNPPAEVGCDHSSHAETKH